MHLSSKGLLTLNMRLKTDGDLAVNSLVSTIIRSDCLKQVILA